MSWDNHPSDIWNEWVKDTADALPDRAFADLILDYRLVPFLGTDESINGSIHNGPLEITGDFSPPALLTVIDGDLTVKGGLSTASIAGFDGNATLIVLGDLKCDTLENEWASLVIVMGDCTVRSWVMAAREDSSFVVGGDFTTPLFIGFDIWVTVGGTVQIDARLGYALRLSDGAVHDLPPEDWQALAKALQLSGLDDEFALVQALEDRLYQTGTLLP